jgi:signal transduction histidine kinase
MDPTQATARQDEKGFAPGKGLPAQEEPLSIEDYRRKEEQYHFLAKAGELLASSLDYEKTLKSIANLIVPDLADWCTVHIQEEDGTIRQLALAHGDPAMMRYAEELNVRYPSDYNAPGGIKDMLLTGKATFLGEITDEMLVKGAKDEEHLKLTRALELSSYMAVPVIARGKAMGVIAFFTAKGKRFTEDDLEFAKLLGSRAALAIDNARLYRDAQRALEELSALNRDLEKKVIERTREVNEAREKDRANLRRLKAMLAHLPQAALMMNDTGQIIELNQRYCEIFEIGLSAAEAMQIPTSVLNERFQRSLADVEGHMKEVAKTIAAKEMRLGHEIHLKDGRIIQRDFLPIYEADLFVGQLFLYRDITKERRIDASKTEFMSLASHQLRTPLTAIRWSFGRLLKNLSGKLGEVEERILSDGVAAAGRMSQTIDTMLQIARIQGGDLKVNDEILNLPLFLQSIAREHEPHFAQKEIILSVECGDDLSVSTDPQLLREIITNLLSNACKYTPEKGSVRLFGSREGAMIRLDVQDSGYGIPLHQQQSVFKKFFRGDNIVSKDPSGTGLGLYLVSLIADLLGGEISFESREGRGTTFRLLLPEHARAAR